jgi:hypothetical protein
VTNFMSRIFGGTAEPADKEPDYVCPKCGNTVTQYMVFCWSKYGPICADCYGDWLAKEFPMEKLQPCEPPSQP